MDLQPLGHSRSSERLLSGQSRRTIGGAVGSRILHPDFGSTAAADHARTRFPDSSATSKCTCSTAKPAPGIRPLGHRENGYSAAPQAAWIVGRAHEKTSVWRVTAGNFAFFFGGGGMTVTLCGSSTARRPAPIPLLPRGRG